MGGVANTNYNDEDVNTGHPWLRSLWEARRSAREAYASINPDVGADRTVFVPDAQQLAHIFLVDYVRHIRPIASEDPSLEELWEYTVHKSTIPQPGSTYEVASQPMLVSTNDNSSTGISTSVAVNGLPTVERNVSLSNVMSYWDTRNEVTFTVESPNGRDKRRVTIYLSRSAIGECLQQADLCLDDLNWLPDAEVGDYTASDAEVLTHE